jgi:hypothetical protein
VKRVQEVAGIVCLPQCEGSLTLGCLGGYEKSENAVSEHGEEVVSELLRDLIVS